MVFFVVLCLLLDAFIDCPQGLFVHRVRLILTLVSTNDGGLKSVPQRPRIPTVLVLVWVGGCVCVCVCVNVFLVSWWLGGWLHAWVGGE